MSICFISRTFVLSINQLNFNTMRNFEMITLQGNLERIEVSRIQRDVNKTVSLPSGHIEMYTDTELEKLIDDKKNLGWEITVID